MKVGIAASAGGHLTEVLQLKKAFRKYPHFFVTFKREDVDRLSNEKVYYIKDPKRNLFKLFYNLFRSLKIFLRERPNVIITTGAGVVVPICYVAKIFKSKIIFIESMAAIYKPSLSGRFVYPISDLFVVQWKNLLKYYLKAIYGVLL
jgi:UDP-N-acetylglucosamine:LPS N-acetylglucosamine transferase